MKTLSIETRRKLSESRSRAWQAKKSHGYDSAFRIEVVQALEKILCSKCAYELRSRCKAQVSEEKRNGCIIACMNACIFVDDELMFTEIPKLGCCSK